MLVGKATKTATSKLAHADHWRFPPSPKYARTGVTRTVSPDETIRRVQDLMPRIGVTRTAEVTNLDRLGIPNFMTVRPLDAGPGITYYNGKGLTRMAARAGALMEAIERYSGEFCDLPRRTVSAANLSAAGEALIDPAGLVVPTVRAFDPHLPIEWVQGCNLLTGEPTWAPLNAVVCPYEGGEGRPPIWYASTNGLASGNTLAEAVSHALCEVFERDALAMSFTALELAPAVDTLIAELTGAPSAPACNDAFPLIDLETLPEASREVARRFLDADIMVFLRDLTAAVDLPIFECTVVERQIFGHVVHGGCGAHPDARVAVARALTEAAQSRIACIQGGREDLPEIIAPPRTFDPIATYGQGPVRSFAETPSFEHNDVEGDIAFLLQRARERGFDQVVALDLTRPDLGVPVVRIVIPGAEAWTVFHLHTGRGVFGTRVADVLRAPR